jgi:hypothetical protein
LLSQGKEYNEFVLAELKETGMYDALLKDVRTRNLNDEKTVDEILEDIETEYRAGTISDEMVRHLTTLICSQS